VCSTSACGVACGAPGLGGAGGGDAAIDAADWDDNRNFAFFQRYRAEAEATYGVDDYPSDDRVTVQIVDASSAPVSGAHVTITPANEVTPAFDGYAGADGQVLFFPLHDAGMGATAFSIDASGPNGEAPTTATGQQGSATWRVSLAATSAGPPTALDVALVVDTTSSMGPTLTYLQANALGIAGAISAAFPQVDARFALVVYRDVHDAYVTRAFDFTSSVDDFNMQLYGQVADGGGDTPEAVELGLGAMNQLSWRPGSVARVAFLVGDAPPHPSSGGAYFDQIDAARRLGVRLYPVGTAGVDEPAEYYFRAGAEATLGRYLFVTSNAPSPTIGPLPCYQVEDLDKLVERMVAVELTGTRVAASTADVLGTVGDPMNGQCSLSDGTTVSF
jgi:hypothetical protein